MIKNTNDGTRNAPRLAAFMNMGSINGLPEFSFWPKLEGKEALAFLKQKGFEGIQGGAPKDCAELGLLCAGGGRVNKDHEAEELARKHKDAGFVCSTLHVGWGLEDEDEVERIVTAILEASAKQDYPLYIETHRATITQDLWRTVQITKKCPEVRFNGDFSHFYTGLEMPYGGLEMKLNFMAPIFERVRFMHGRIGSSGCMQVDIGDGTREALQNHGKSDFVDDFRQMWTRSMAGFLKSAQPGDYLGFAPELLSSDAYYARKFVNREGELVEEGDRFTQSLLYVEMAKECFARAKE